MGVSKNRGTPKWMVYMEHPIKMDDLGVPLFLETPKYLKKNKTIPQRVKGTHELPNLPSPLLRVAVAPVAPALVAVQPRLVQPVPPVSLGESCGQFEENERSKVAFKSFRRLLFGSVFFFLRNSI